jgi:serine/threonine protein kinase
MFGANGWYVYSNLQLVRAQNLHTAIDVWAVGTILLFFLTGKFPLFQCTDDNEALMEIACILGKKKMEKAATLHSRLIHRVSVVIPLIVLCRQNVRDQRSIGNRDWHYMERFRHKTKPRPLYPSKLGSQLLSCQSNGLLRGRYDCERRIHSSSVIVFPLPRLVSFFRWLDICWRSEGASGARGAQA